MQKESWARRKLMEEEPMEIWQLQTEKLELLERLRQINKRLEYLLVDKRNQDESSLMKRKPYSAFGG